MTQPKLVIIDTLQALDDLYVYLMDKEYIAFDTETNGVHKGAEIIGLSVCAEESVAYYIITAAWNTETKKLDYNPHPLFKEALVNTIASLKTKHLIAHNAVFDCAMIESNYKVSLIDSLHTDTMILAHLLNENRRVGLKELGADLFGQDSTKEAQEMKASVLANGGQLTKANFEMYKADAQLMAKYGAKDAWLTYMLFMALVPELYEEGLDKFFYEDESMPLLKTCTYELNTKGLIADSAALMSLKKTLQAECAEAKEFIYREIQPHIQAKYPGDKKNNKFNIGASQQLSWLLFGVLNLEFGTLTAGGKTIAKQLGLKVYSPSEKRNFIHTVQTQVGSMIQPEAIVNGKKVKAKTLKMPWAYIAVDKKTLAKLAPKYKWIERLLEYQRKMKLLTTYVRGIEEKTQYGVIRPSFLQTGTTTGRYASRNPNFQNLPRNDQRVKECIVARPGKVFVSADFSQLEPRVFAYYSQDPRLMAAFDGTTDFYSVVGAEVYDKTDCTLQKEGSPDAFGVKYKQLRDLAKVIALASAYGATPNQLAPTTGKSIDDTKEDMEKYFERFAGVRKMMVEAHRLVKKNGQVTNLFGRKRRIPEATKITKIYGDMDHWDYPYNVRQLLNMACNFRIQSTGASIVNRAAIAFHNACKTAEIECSLVLQVHDELIAECNEKDAENVSLLLQHSMENTTPLEGVALEAIPRITRTLAK